MDGEASTERLYSANGLAKLAGVGATTIHNWTIRPARALTTVEAPSGRRMYRVSDLHRFIGQNPDLRGAAATRLRLAAMGPKDADPQRSDTQGTLAQPSSGEEAEALRAAVRDLKTAVDASIQAVARSAQLAEHTAVAHREVIAALQVVVRAYDSAMATATESRTLHD